MVLIDVIRLEEFRKYLGPKLSSHPELTDTTLMRFLTARDFSHEKTKKMLENYLSWLESNKLREHNDWKPFVPLRGLQVFPDQNVSWDPPYAQIAACFGGCAFHKFDKNGCPIYIERSGFHDTLNLSKVGTMENVLNFHILSNEFLYQKIIPLLNQKRAIPPHPVDPLTLVSTTTTTTTTTTTGANFMGGGGLESSSAPDVGGKSRSGSKAGHILESSSSGDIGAGKVRSGSVVGGGKKGIEAWSNNVIENGATETITAIIDLKGLGFHQFHLPALKMGKGIGEVDQHYYPERLSCLYIVNAPSIFGKFWNFIKGSLDKKVLEKTKIFAEGENFTEALLESIEPENLPSFLGGRCECQMEGGCVPCFLPTLPQELRYEKEVEIKAREVYRVELKCEKIDSLVSVKWKSKTELSYSVSFLSSPSADPKKICESKQYESHKEEAEHSFQVNDVGTYEIIFSNKHNLLRSNQLFYTIRHLDQKDLPE